MKMYNCKSCGKIITEEEIGFRDEEGNVFCKACALKLTVEENAEEAPEEKPANTHVDIAPILAQDNNMATASIEFGM